jgi:hypothetical protein
MSVLCKDLTADGKRYDSIGRYQLIIHVGRNDNRGQLIEAMARGFRRSSSSETDLINSQSQFLNLVKLTVNIGDFAYYGMTAVIDTKENTLSVIDTF